MQNPSCGTDPGLPREILTEIDDIFYKFTRFADLIETIADGSGQVILTEQIYLAAASMRLFAKIGMGHAEALIQKTDAPKGNNNKSVLLKSR